MLKSYALCMLIALSTIGSISFVIASQMQPITLPTVEILKANLAELDLTEFVDQTKLVEKLHSGPKSMTDIYATVEQAEIDYRNHLTTTNTDQHLTQFQIAMVVISKPSLYELLFKNHPEIVAELRAKRLAEME